MISVCIATYNGDRFIKKQLQSILIQLSPEDEVIISDNKSMDNTIKCIEELKDDRIKIISFPQKVIDTKYSRNHYLVTSNFENALRQAKGDFIFLSDQDDIWERDKVRKFLPYLQRGEFVMSNMSIIDENDNLKKINSMSHKRLRGFLYNLAFLPFHGCCIAFPSTLLNYALPFPEKMILHDSWLGLVAQKMQYKISFIDEPLTLYRKHGNNVSHNHESNPLSFKIMYRLGLMLQVLKRCHCF